MLSRAFLVYWTFSLVNLLGCQMFDSQRSATKSKPMPAMDLPPPNNLATNPAPTSPRQDPATPANPQRVETSPAGPSPMGGNIAGSPFGQANQSPSGRPDFGVGGPIGQAPRMANPAIMSPAPAHGPVPPPPPRTLSGTSSPSPTPSDRGVSSNVVSPSVVAPGPITYDPTMVQPKIVVPSVPRPPEPPASPSMPASVAPVSVAVPASSGPVLPPNVPVPPPPPVGLPVAPGR